MTPPAPGSKGGRQGEARRPAPYDDAPKVTYTEGPAGRETLAAIAEAGVDFPREPAKTRHYGDRISNAPGAMSPRHARALDDQPELSVSFLPAGRETYAAINHELSHEPPEIEITEGDASSEPVNLAALEIQQMATFLVRAPLAALETASQRRHLVESRLLRHLPVSSLRQVTHVDVRPWQEPGMLLVRVWCQVD